VLSHNLAHDNQGHRGGVRGARLGQMLRRSQGLCARAGIFSCCWGATYTMVFWIPTLIQSWGVKGPAADRHLCGDPERVSV